MQQFYPLNSKCCSLGLFTRNCILGMPFLQKFNLKIDCVAWSVHVDGYALPVGLGRPMQGWQIEMVCANTFVSELK